VPVASVLQSGPLLPIFWILPVVGPMFTKGTQTTFPACLSAKGITRMKHTCLLLAALSLLAVVTGCKCGAGSCAAAPENCSSCASPQGCNDPGCPPGGESAKGMPVLRPRALDNAGRFTPGPPTGAVTYPYYTTRGPRDFLAQKPESIGP
jgi:hypothetical protein